MSYRREDITRTMSFVAKLFTGTDRQVADAVKAAGKDIEKQVQTKRAIMPGQGGGGRLPALEPLGGPSSRGGGRNR